MTGGTIASVDNGHGLEPVTDNFFRPIADQVDCDINFITPFNLDSSQVLPSHWVQLAKLVDKERRQYHGIVIAHGTDTMAYTGTALSFMLRNIEIPVVLTGSQIPLSAPYSDGHSNVALALQAAHSSLRGVLVAFGGRLMRGNACSKTYSDNLIGFESINAPYVELGGTDPVQGAYELNLDYEDNLFLLKMAPGIKPTFIPELVKLGYRRIVIEAYGKGGVPEAFLAPIRDAVEHGVKIGITTQCTYDGSDCYVYKSGRELLETGVWDYKKHTTEYAVVHMMFRK